MDITKQAGCSQATMKPYAVQLIEAALRASQTKAALRNRRVLMPYCVIECDSDCIMLLNRGYMPLGVSHSSGCIDPQSPNYESLRLPSAGLDRAALRAGDYFFNDGCSPFTGSEADRNLYLFRTWWALRRYGLVYPNIPIPPLERSAIRCGIEFRQTLREARI